MKFHETILKGAYIIEIEKTEDERGFFARTFDKKSFLKLDLETELFQCNVSFNKKAGTLRGMHYQTYPYEEVKIVRCTKGKIFDVIIDLRPDSQSYRKWFGIEWKKESCLELGNARSGYELASSPHSNQTPCSFSVIGFA